MVKVITYGTYDLLHYGHIRLLERAKALGDYLIVGVTSDDYDKTRGKINNQQSLMERVASIKETGLADEIIVEEYEGQKIDDIRRYDIDIFAIGSDWEGKFDYLSEYCKVIYLPRTEGVSSSDLRAEKRKLSIGAIGDEGLCKKFINELQYVNGITYVTDYEKMDAVYIATHAEKHFSDIRKALIAGKHVICEMPIVTNINEFHELFQIAKENHLVLEDAIKTAYSTAYSRLLVVAKSGRIGDIVSVDAICTSLEDGAGKEGANLAEKQNSMCAWGPLAMLPVFQLLGTEYRSKTIVTKFIDKKLLFDGFTKIDFIYEKATASIKVAKNAKSEGELIITGTKGYIYVPAPWWKTDYFEIRYENPVDNKRYFYQLDGEGIRYEIVEFAKAIEKKSGNYYISTKTSEAICQVIQDYYEGQYIEIK